MSQNAEMKKEQSIRWASLFGRVSFLAKGDWQGWSIKAGCPQVLSPADAMTEIMFCHKFIDQG